MKRGQVFGELNEGLYLLKRNSNQSVSNSASLFGTDVLQNTLSVYSSISLPKSVVLENNSTTSSSSISDVLPGSRSVFVSFSFSASITSDVRLWHNRLGYLPLSSMKNISYFSFPTDSEFLCEVCHLAKQTRLPFQLSQIHSKGIFELIHIDTWGPYRIPTHDEHKYFLTIVDDYSRGTWTFLLTTKSNAFLVLKQFLSMVDRQFGVKIKRIRSDNALELGRGSLEDAFLDS